MSELEAKVKGYRTTITILEAISMMPTFFFLKAYSVTYISKSFNDFLAWKDGSNGYI